MYKYFTVDELHCQHCGRDGMNQVFMQRVEALREKVGFPFIISSAYRCPDHPIEARKSSPGAHASGKALDITCSGTNAYELLKASLAMDFTGIGVNQTGTSRFIHLDTLEDAVGRPRPRVWSY